MSGKFDRTVPQYIACGTGANLNITGDQFTMWGWIKPDNSDGGDRCWSKANTVVASPFIQYSLLVDSNESLVFHLEVGGLKAIVTAAAAIPDNAWSFVMCRYDGVNMELFIDKNGAPSASTPQAGNIGSHPTWPFNIATTDYDKASQSYNGQVFGLQVHTRALTLVERNTYFDSDGRIYPTDAFEGFWKMGDESGNIVTEIDLSGNGNDGTGSGTPIYVADPFAPNFSPKIIII